MTGAMIIVEADLPQGTPCECIEMGTADTFRKHQSSDRNVALQHARHALLQLHRWDSGPVQTVRVMSVVPSRYRAPELIR